MKTLHKYTTKKPFVIFHPFAEKPLVNGYTWNLVSGILSRTVNQLGRDFFNLSRGCNFVWAQISHCCIVLGRRRQYSAMQLHACYMEWGRWKQWIIMNVHEVKSQVTQYFNSETNKFHHCHGQHTLSQTETMLNLCSVNCAM